MNQLSFIQKGRSILMDNVNDRLVPFQKTGKTLDLSRIALVRCGVENLFMRKREKQFKDYAISLLMDASGSMTHGNKISVASDATHMLAYSLLQIGATVKVSLFDKRVDEVPLETVLDRKKMNELAYKHLHEHGDGNHDGYAVITTARKLARMPQKGKIMLVLSDGQPHCKGCSEEGCPAPKGGWKSGGDEISEVCNQVLVKAVSQTRRDLNINLLGLGILTEAPVRFYGERQTTVVNSLDKLYEEMMRLLGRNLKRG